jgi:hypothetical protein
MNTERSGLSQKEVVSKKPLGVLQMEKIWANKKLTYPKLKKEK